MGSIISGIDVTDTVKIHDGMTEVSITVIFIENADLHGNGKLRVSIPPAVPIEMAEWMLSTALDSVKKDRSKPRIFVPASFGENGGAING